jgi:HD superfamily phosphohydrolase
MSVRLRDYFYDPIWGFFEPPIEVIKILDTHEVQRLSRVSQLSLVNLVYRSANHTRLEHSIGVTNLVDKAMNRFQVDRSAWPDERTFNEYMPKWPVLKKFAEVCAIIHDVGHGPFSHFVEPFLQWTGQEFRTNEEIGEDVILGKYEHVDRELAPKDAIFLKDALMEVSKELGFSLNDFATFVTGEAQFVKKFRASTTPHLFIRRLVSSPIDMDRVDFLNRDSYFVGLKGGVDAYSIIQNLSLITNDEGALELVMEEAGIFHVEALLTSRDLMYAIVYHNPVNRWGLATVLRSAYKLYKDYNVPSEYILRQTDATLLAMLKEGDAYTRKIAQRIEERRPYNRVFELEFSYLNLKNLPNGNEVVGLIQELEKEPLKLLELENTVKNKLSPQKQGSDEIDVIIDIPYPLKFIEAEVKVKTSEQLRPTPLNRVSHLARYISERSKERRWFLNVFTNAHYQSSAYQRVVELVKKELQIPLHAHPSRLLPD